MNTREIFSSKVLTQNCIEHPELGPACHVPAACHIHSLSPFLAKVSFGLQRMDRRSHRLLLQRFRKVVSLNRNLITGCYVLELLGC